MIRAGAGRGFFSRLVLLIGGVAAFVLIAFLVGLFSNARVEAAEEMSVFRPPREAKLREPALLPAAERLAIQVQEKERALSRAKAAARSKPHRSDASTLSKPTDRALSIGFYVNWDDASFPAFKRSLSYLDWIMPGCMSLQGPQMALPTDIEQRALDYICSTRPTMPILPMIQNAHEGVWDGAGLARMLADPAARAARVQQIVALLYTDGFDGLTLDFTAQNLERRGLAALGCLTVVPGAVGAWRRTVLDGLAASRPIRSPKTRT